MYAKTYDIFNEYQYCKNYLQNQMRSILVKYVFELASCQISISNEILVRCVVEMVDKEHLTEIEQSLQKNKNIIEKVTENTIFF